IKESFQRVKKIYPVTSIMVFALICSASLVAAPVASASICGYSQELKDYPSVLSLNLLGQGLDLFGGRKVVAV
ncbi:hypothetical protein, partial [Rathayibacter toxicus]|uniref:hypothetical protein n=1 Tax=Rathayibacter toxicus TaxID=145458 RepID=UPI001C1037FE